MSAAMSTAGHHEGHGVIPFWRAVYEIARKEVIVFTRTKRLYITGGIFAFGMLVTSIFWAVLFNQVFGGTVGGLFGPEQAVEVSRANVVMGMAIGSPFLGAYTFLNLLGIVFTFDAITREYEDKTLFLLLAKPVSRPAFVLGKYVGAVFSVGALFLIIGTITYFIVMMVVGQFAAPMDFLRFYLGVLMLLMGMFALSAMALFWSAIVRSMFASAVLSFLTWAIVLNILANAGLIYAGFSQDLSADHPVVQGMRYLNPSNSAGPSVLVMLNLVSLGSDIGFAVPITGFDLDPLLSQLSLVLFAGAFLLATILVVNRRNFE